MESEGGNWSVSEAARQLHRNAIVWDMVLPLMKEVGNDFAVLARYEAAGFSYISFTIAGDDAGIAETMQRIASTRAELLRRPDRYLLVETADDVLRAKREGRLAVSMHFEGTRCLERNLDMVEAYYRLGIRHVLLAFNVANSAGGGCAEPEDRGLTGFGRRLIGEFNRVGMLLDLSHTGYRTTMEAMEISAAPVIISHSNAHAVHPHYRNVRDDQIKACARSGGVVGISGSSVYLGGFDISNDRIFRHIDHIVQLVGPRHVGIGTDYIVKPAALLPYFRARPDEWPTTEGWTEVDYARPEQFPELTDLLLRHRYSEADVRGILGENFLRVARQVWR
jgi:membrane dipeptidase